MSQARAQDSIEGGRHVFQGTTTVDGSLEMAVVRYVVVLTSLKAVDTQSMRQANQRAPRLIPGVDTPAFPSAERPVPAYCCSCASMERGDGQSSI